MIEGRVVSDGPGAVGGCVGGKRPEGNPSTEVKEEINQVKQMFLCVQVAKGLLIHLKSLLSSHWRFPRDSFFPVLPLRGIEVEGTGRETLLIFGKRFMVSYQWGKMGRRFLSSLVEVTYINILL